MDLTLSSPLALAIFIAACIGGANFRRVWAREGPTWQLWVSGLIAAFGFMTIALIPLG